MHGACVIPAVCRIQHGTPQVFSKLFTAFVALSLTRGELEELMYICCGTFLFCGSCMRVLILATVFTFWVRVFRRAKVQLWFVVRVRVFN